MISESSQEVARGGRLRDSTRLHHRANAVHPENRLLTGIRKLARPQLKKFYGERVSSGS